MTIKYVLLVNKQGQTRLSKYYAHYPAEEKISMEGNIIRQCLSRSSSQCSFVDFQDHIVVYRRYAALFLIIGIEPSDNELGVLEVMQLFVEVLDKYFKGANELDIMFSLNRCHLLLDEMIMNGDIIETNSTNILAALGPIDEQAKQQNS